MYGDPDVMRRRVDDLREQADDVRALADRLVAQTEAVGWTGRAADSMRVRVTERATHLRAAALQHEAAADSLERHVVEVEHRQEQVAELERRASEIVGAARARVAEVDRRNEAAAAGTPRIDPDPVDVVLVGFEPPPSGHADWLTVELPGLTSPGVAS
jgi:primosomal protein N''